MKPKYLISFFFLSCLLISKESNAWPYPPPECLGNHLAIPFYCSYYSNDLQPYPTPFYASYGYPYYSPGPSVGGLITGMALGGLIGASSSGWNNNGNWNGGGNTINNTTNNNFDNRHIKKTNAENKIAPHDLSNKNMHAEENKVKPAEHKMKPRDADRKMKQRPDKRRLHGGRHRERRERRR